MSELRPFWERHPWLIRPAAIALLIVSPIVFPMMAIVANWGMLSRYVRDLHMECVRAVKKVPEASSAIFSSRCPMCSYQHGHQIGCENNPIDIALRAAALEMKK